MVLTISLLPLSGVQAQYIAGTVKFKWEDTSHADRGTKIFLCHRGQDMHVDHDRVLQKERVLQEYDLSRIGTPKQMTKHKRELARQYGVSDSADMNKYFIEAANEEAKIIAANDVQIRLADSAGHYRFDNVTAGSYWVLIRSCNTNKTCCVAIDFFENNKVIINRIFGEYSAEKLKKFYTDESLQ